MGSEAEFAALESNLRERLARVFAEIQRAANDARTGLVYDGKEKAGRRFYDDQPPLVRLVCGAALGTDTLGMGVVADGFRGDLMSLDRRVPLPMRAPGESLGEAGHAEWQIDMILPFGKADFVREAFPDFARRHASNGWTRDEMESRFARHWRHVLGLPDTTVTLPPFWRRGSDKPAGGADANANSHEDMEAAQRVASMFGKFAEAPTVPPATDICLSQDAAQADRIDLALDYRPGGRFLVRQIDVLVVVWDGHPARGAGGAPDLAAAAVEQGIPVVCIDPGRPDDPPHMIQKIERIEAHHAIVGWQPVTRDRKLSQADACVGELADAILKLLSPPADEEEPGRGHARKRSDFKRAVDFLEDCWPKAEEAKVYKAFQGVLAEPRFESLRALRAALFAGPKQTDGDEAHWSDDNWTRFINSNPDEGYQAIGLKHVLHRRFVLVDTLAVKYADLYRGAFIKTYLWAALAVIAAIIGLAIGAHPGWEYAKLVLLFIEVGIIWSILRRVTAGEHAHWHERFLHYRALAESLRHLRFLATFADFGAAGRSTGEGREAWWLWYLRATSRELGLPEGDLGPSYQESLLTAVLKYELLPQLDYHRKTERTESASEEAAHKWAKRFFTLTLLLSASAAAAWVCADIVALFRLPESIGAMVNHGKSLGDILHEIEHHEPEFFRPFHGWEVYIGLIAAALPTLGAALACIRFTADFEGKASRSRAMIEDLREMGVTVCEARKRQEFDYTGDVLKRTARAMSEDVEAFLSLYGLKPLILPG